MPIEIAGTADVPMEQGADGARPHQLYAGPLVRWYRQEFPGGSPIDDPPDPRDVRALVQRWQAAVRPAIGEISWNEADDAPTLAAVLPPGTWDSLCAVAARTWAGLEPDGDPGPDDEAIAAAQEARPRDCRFYPILHAIAWLPASFDGVLAIGLPDRPSEGALASIDRLSAALMALNLESLRASSSDLASLRAGADAATAIASARIALAVALPVIELARSARVPMLLAEQD